MCNMLSRQAQTIFSQPLKHSMQLRSTSRVEPRRRHVTDQLLARKKCNSHFRRVLGKLIPFRLMLSRQAGASPLGPMLPLFGSPGNLAAIPTNTVNAFSQLSHFSSKCDKLLRASDLRDLFQLVIF